MSGIVNNSICRNNPENNDYCIKIHFHGYSPHDNATWLYGLINDYTAWSMSIKCYFVYAIDWMIYYFLGIHYLGCHHPGVHSWKEQ